MPEVPEECQVSPAEEPCPVKRGAREVVCTLAEMRPTLVVFGAISALLSYQTHYGYTTEQLPMRDLCSILLITMAVVGMSCIFLRPVPPLREWFGLALMFHSVLRGIGFWIAAERQASGFTEFVQQASPVSVHAILAFLGFLLWARAHHPTSTRR